MLFTPRAARSGRRRRPFFDELDAEFRFTLDPCATPANAKCRRFFTRDLDGLSQDWDRHHVFCNPPYCRMMHDWGRKCFEASRRGALVVLLAHARTDTRWFHDWVYGKAAEIRFVRGRLKFGDGCQSGPFRSLVAIYRPDIAGPTPPGDRHPGRAGAAWYDEVMAAMSAASSPRRPRFRRASEPPAFRLTDDDVEIVRLLARHRFLRSTHIAVLVGRSLDRTNDRLSRLFHAGYLDRPRAQLDYYPTAGSAPIAYALADRGARLLIERDGTEFANVEWSRKNRSAGRPFIEHQLEVMDFYVALQLAAQSRDDVRLIHPDEMVATFPDQSFAEHNPFALRVRLSHQGAMRETAIVPDLVFGIRFRDGSRRCFVVEVDRGTMPVTRSDIRQTSFERKMRAYLTAHAAKQHERHFGWKTFRVLTVTTDQHRMKTMMDALRRLRIPRSYGPALFFFTTRDTNTLANPISETWFDGNGRDTTLI